MLHDVAALNIPEEFEGSSIAEELISAIRFAQSGDDSMIQRIADLLKKVDADIVKHPLRG
jgi:hypothetical protein